jgi:hypothetical protein
MLREQRNVVFLSFSCFFHLLAYTCPYVVLNLAGASVLSYSVAVCIIILAVTALL